MAQREGKHREVALDLAPDLMPLVGAISGGEVGQKLDYRGLRAWE